MAILSTIKTTAEARGTSWRTVMGCRLGQFKTWIRHTMVPLYPHLKGKASNYAGLMNPSRSGLLFRLARGKSVMRL